MYLFFTCLNAFEYCIVSDRSIKQLNSTKKFETSRDRLLFETIMQFMVSFQTHEDYFHAIRILHRYTCGLKKKSSASISADEIKLMFAAHILKTFDFGKFNFGMLYHANDFDNELEKHVSILASYDIEKIFESVEKQISDYSDEDDYKINLSYAYLTQAYTTLFHDTLVNQARGRHWIYKIDNVFEKKLAKVIPNAKLILKVVFHTVESQIADIHFALPSFFEELFFSDTYKPYLKHKGNHVQVIVIYSNSELVTLAMPMDAFYRKDELVPNNQKHPSAWAKFLVGRYSPFTQHRDLLKSEEFDDKNYPVCQFSELSKYETFFVENKKEENSFIAEWAEKAAITININRALRKEGIKYFKPAKYFGYD